MGSSLWSKHKLRKPIINRHELETICDEIKAYSLINSLIDEGMQGEPQTDFYHLFVDA